MPPGAPCDLKRAPADDVLLDVLKHSADRLGYGLL